MHRQPLSEQSVRIQWVLGAQYRANPSYTLFRFDQLPSDQQDLFAQFRQDPTMYGVLVPRTHTGLGVKLVDDNTAGLFATLSTPGAFPRHTGTAYETWRAIAELVSDGVLELWSDGGWISGPRAHAILGAPRARAPEGRAGLVNLSRGALRYGQAIGLTDPRLLSWRLYTYHTFPFVRRWRERFASPQRVADAVGLGPGTHAVRLLSEAYVELEHPAWRVWNRPPDSQGQEIARPAFKLYLSVHPDALTEALPIAVEAFVQLGVRSFKVGRDLAGLLRSDKCVAYFATWEDLQQVADTLQRALRGCQAHGVPFSAPLMSDGLLSWGIDPPPDPQLAEWTGHESWRLWMTNRLARALILAQSCRDRDREPWLYALDRLELEGIDTITWTPVEVPWLDFRRADAYA